jgi:hypothetical protein
MQLEDIGTYILLPCIGLAAPVPLCVCPLAATALFALFSSALATGAVASVGFADGTGMGFELSGSSDIMSMPLALTGEISTIPFL